LEEDEQLLGLRAFLSTPRHGHELAAFLIGSALFFTAVMAVLHMLPARTKRWLIVGFTFVAGLFYLLEFMLPPGTLMASAPPSTTDNFLSRYVEPVGYITQIIGAVAIGLGVINLARVNGAPLLRFAPGWQNSVAFFAGLISMTVVGLWRWKLLLGVTTLEGEQAVASSTIGCLHRFLFDGLYANLGGTVFALLAFYIVSASYRAFRLRSAEATIMMITAFIVMLGNVPVGTAYLTGWIPEGRWYSFLKVEHLSDWIMNVPNMAAQRALIFGIMMGVIAVSLRIWLSLERGRFFEQEL